MPDAGQFKPGDMVALRADPSRSGPVMHELPAVAGQARYRVYHGPDDTQDYYESQLEAISARSSGDSLTDALRSGEFLSAENLKARLTAARLATPLTDNLYALRAARIRSIPFQYKPLIRFLRSDRPRLLISDEVGVGKTIEAGLILKEMETRQDLENVLVVCPKALVSKWRLEMRRFDEDFRELTADNLRYCLRETAYDGAWPGQFSRAIVPLELIRAERYLQGEAGGQRRFEGLLELNPPPQFGLLVVDEAHHLRNPETGSHRLARFLCEISEAVLFLTATPVHRGSKDLYSLLSLLRPDLFRDQQVFEEMVEPNRYVVQAMRHMRTGAPPETWQQNAAAQLEQALGTAWGKRSLQADPRFLALRQQLTEALTLSDEERVRGVRDLEELHSLALVMNRTRRRDVGAFTVREPHAVPVPFSPEQAVFYKELINFRREVLLQDYDPRIVRLIIDTLERQASSCLPAMATAIDSFLLRAGIDLDSVTDSAEELLDLEGLALNSLQAQAIALREQAEALPLGDPKFDQFAEIIESTVHAEGKRKVLVFSFFLHTISYLEKRLREFGFRVGVVTGRVPDQERETLRQRFRLPFESTDAIDILLSSEVGCEGLDYEFCDCLVNYDLPWNPMRIEQRIGRIDRFGQTSPKVLIYNFITPGTVEERIFHRCFERLGVFKDTVGDIEEVLGELVQDLTRLALDPELSLDQAEERAQQLADNVVLLAEERRRLEQDSTLLIGMDQTIDDEVQDVVDDGRYVSADDLRGVVEWLLARLWLKGRLSREERSPGVYTLRIDREGRQALSTRVRAIPRQDRVVAEFRRWLEGEEQALLLTFDQDLALEQRQLPFITPVHPLAKVAVQELTRSEEPLVSSLSVFNKEMPPGEYLFSCELWDVVAARRESTLKCFAVDLPAGRSSDVIANSLLMLLKGASSNQQVISLESLDPALTRLDENVHEARSTELGRLRARNDLEIDRKLAALEAYHRSRMERVGSDIAQATEPRIRRMRQAEQSRIERDYEASRMELELRRMSDVVGKRVALGLLKVRPG